MLGNKVAQSASALSSTTVEMWLEHRIHSLVNELSTASEALVHELEGQNRCHGMPSLRRTSHETVLFEALAEGLNRSSLRINLIKGGVLLPLLNHVTPKVLGFLGFAISRDYRSKGLKHSLRNRAFRLINGMANLLKRAHNRLALFTLWVPRRLHPQQGSPGLGAAGAAWAWARQGPPGLARQGPPGLSSSPLACR